MGPLAVESVMRPTIHLALWLLGLEAAETQTTEAERACLAKLADGKRRIAEIGVWHGVTTSLLRSRMAADGLLLAVDPFPAGRLGFSPQRLIARREVTRAPGGPVQWLRMPGAAAAHFYATHYDDPIDLVFLDGDHSLEAVLADWSGWAPLVGEGGSIALHDSRSCASRSLDGVGSERFTRECVLLDCRYSLTTTVDSLTVVRRR